ncbi:RNA 2'-phosphotransferase [Arenicella sp. 4NH20-0111]|uniref:RNA 2'-phosphotransferase n=1 Tax=Arenicella sp. 4NH20-0111 TaxID=3127648 RepID=UPI003341F6F6
MDLKKISKYLSFILRHQPDSIGLELSDEGWANINELIGKTRKFKLTKELIDTVVASNDKKRFLVSDDGLRIKANQGHSVNVKLELEPMTPPDVLLHGTAERFLDSIFRQGLKKQQRHHVHLSETQKTALSVGARYGKPVLLKVDSKLMHEHGLEFFMTENDVWLVDEVPVEYLTLNV